jgi:hypothetical protein
MQVANSDAQPFNRADLPRQAESSLSSQTLFCILELPVHVNEPNHRTIIATSWGGMLGLLLAMLMLSPLQ